MPKENGLELRVGAFVAAALLSLIVFVFSISDFSFFDKGDDYSAVFTYANGLKKGAPVRLAGVDAGHVKDLVIYYDKMAFATKIKVSLWVKRGVVIPADSKVLINQLGLLGEKYVEIIPGKTNDRLLIGSVMLGEDPVAMESIMAMVGSIAGKIDLTMEEVNKRFLTDGNTQALADSLQNIAAITSSVRNGEGSIGKLLKDQELYQNLSLTLANVAILTGKMNNGQGSLGKFINDQGIYNNLEEMTLDLKHNPWKLFYRAKSK